MFKKYVLLVVLLAGFSLLNFGCGGGGRSERRYDIGQGGSRHSDEARYTTTDARARLIDPRDYVADTNNVPASDIAKGTASRLAQRMGLAANQGLRNSVSNYDNTLAAPANPGSGRYMAFTKGQDGKTHAVVVDSSSNQILGDAEVVDNKGQAQLVCNDGGRQTRMDTGLLMHDVREGNIIIEGSKQAIDLEMYAERANFQKDQYDDARSQMAFGKAMRGLSVIGGTADVTAFSTDRLASSVNSWRQIVGADPRGVIGGFRPFQGGTTVFGQFFNNNRSGQFISGRQY